MKVTHPASLARVGETQHWVHAGFVTDRPFTLIAHHCGQEQDRLNTHFLPVTARKLVETFLTVLDVYT